MLPIRFLLRNLLAGCCCCYCLRIVCLSLFLPSVALKSCSLKLLPKNKRQRAVNVWRMRGRSLKEGLARSLPRNSFRPNFQREWENSADFHRFFFLQLPTTHTERAKTYFGSFRSSSSQSHTPIQGWGDLWPISLPLSLSASVSLIITRKYFSAIAVIVFYVILLSSHKVTSPAVNEWDNLLRSDRPEQQQQQRVSVCLPACCCCLADLLRYS